MKFVGFKNIGIALAVLCAADAAHALGPRPQASSPSVTLASDNVGTAGVPPSKGIVSIQGPARSSSTPAAPVIVSLDDRAACTYSFSASFTPTATGAVTLASVTGSATKTVRVKRVFLSGHSTANAQETIALQRTSALGAGGTVVSPTAAKYQTGCAAATAVVSHYTSTLKAAGTGVGGPINTQDFWTGVVTTPTVFLPGVLLWPEADATTGPAIALSGVSDFLEIQSVNAGNLSAGTVLQYTIVLEEE